MIDMLSKSSFKTLSGIKRIVSSVRYDVCIHQNAPEMWFIGVCDGQVPDMADATLYDEFGIVSLAKLVPTEQRMGHVTYTTAEMGISSTSSGLNITGIRSKKVPLTRSGVATYLVVARVMANAADYTNMDEAKLAELMGKAVLHASVITRRDGWCDLSSPNSEGIEISNFLNLHDISYLYRS